ncbi:MAG: hypothetical protein AMDU4_FER2C00007G0002, partial [Ferroplasma sp. Type II]
MAENKVDLPAFGFPINTIFNIRIQLHACHIPLGSLS